MIYQKDADEKFDKIFTYISEHEEVSQKIFFEGQIYDAFSLLTELVSKAERFCLHIINLAANVCGYTPINLGKIIKEGVLADVPSIHRMTIERQVEINKEIVAVSFRKSSNGRYRIVTLSI